MDVDNDQIFGQLKIGDGNRRVGDVFYVYGLIVASNISLPELHQAESAPPHCSFELLEPGTPPHVSEWLHHWDLPSGRPWRSCAKQGFKYLLRFHNLADFNIALGGDHITCTAFPGTPIETVRHLLLDQVIPLCVGLRGREAIHASSVETPFGTCGFSGDTGSGKSTLVASLTAAGCRLFGDDCLALDEVDGQVVAFAGYPGLRLWPTAMDSLFSQTEHVAAVSHYNQKKRVPLGVDNPTVCRALKALFVLAPPNPESPSTIQAEPIPSAEALTELLKQSFRLDVTDRERLVRQFKFFCRMLTQVPLYRLSYPRDFSRLPEVRQAILCALQK